MNHNDLLFQVNEAGHGEFEHLSEKDHGDCVVAVGGGPVPGGCDQHPLRHEHHHVRDEHNPAPRAGKQLRDVLFV